MVIAGVKAQRKRLALVDEAEIYAPALPAYVDHQIHAAAVSVLVKH